MTKSAAIAFRVEPEIKTAAVQAAVDDHRSVASLLEKLLVEHLRSTGYLPANGADPSAADQTHPE